MTQILIAGDPHGDIGYIDYLCDVASKSDIEKIVLLGDTGMWWPGGFDFMDDVEYMARHYDLDIYSIDGNHDGHSSLPHDDIEFFEMKERFYYIPRGFSWIWGDIKFLAMGGAWSIDKDGRVPHVSWWPQEEPTYAQIQRAINVGKVDIVLAHDAPSIATIPGYSYINDEAERTRKNLSYIWDSSKCDLWLHGHWHRRYTDVIDGRVIQGLAHNYQPSRAWTLLTIGD